MQNLREPVGSNKLLFQPTKINTHYGMCCSKSINQWRDKNPTRVLYVYIYLNAQK